MKTFKSVRRQSLLYFRRGAICSGHELFIRHCELCNITCSYEYITSRYRIFTYSSREGRGFSFQVLALYKANIQIAACFSGLSSYLTENAVHFQYEGQSNVCTQVFRCVRKIAKSDCQLSARPSVRTELLCSLWTNFHEI